MKISGFMIIIMLLISSGDPQDFMTSQKKFDRVKQAIKEKEGLIQANLKKHELRLDHIRILMIAYKDEDLLELYARDAYHKKYKQIALYHICAKSGKPGPKRKQGDSQVPEGFYHIDKFNPLSNYYLSLGINYPNWADRRKSHAGDLGGDVFIHGECVTIGCLPMTNDKIKEIYLYAIHAKDGGQESIPVYIFPFKMTEARMQSFSAKYSHDKELLDFWKTLKNGYNRFMKEYEPVAVKIDKYGNYVFD